jgi:hypothetical protein
MANERLKLKELKATVKTQTREEINQDVLADYKAHAKAAKDKGADPSFPPLVAFRDIQGDVWLADGFTRRQALLATGFEEYAVEVHEGDKRDAIKYGFKANQEHGARLTNADKQHNLKLALEDPEWAELSGSALAELVGVSEAFVRKNRPVAKKPDTVTSKSGKKMKAGNIGKKTGATKKKKEPKKKAAAAAAGSTGGDGTPPATPAPKPDAELEKAYGKIAKAVDGHGFVGADVVAAIKDGSLPLSAPDVKKFGGTSDERIRLLAPLVVNLRWSVGKAIGFIDKEPSADTKAEHFMNLAVAHGGLVREKVGNAGCVWFIAEDYTVGEAKDGTITLTPKKKKK